MLSRDDAQVHSAAELDTTASAAQARPTTSFPPTGQIPAHPLAEIFPLLGKEALRELAGDIAERGLIDPSSRMTAEFSTAAADIARA